MKKIIFSTHPVKHPRGYTIIELLFAVANFTFILMIAISAFIVVMRIYNKAAFARQTQQAARSAMEQMMTDMRLSSVRRPVMKTSNEICINTKNSGAGGSINVKYRLDGSGWIFRDVFTTGTDCTGPFTSTQITADAFRVDRLDFEMIRMRTGSDISYNDSPDSTVPEGTAVRIDLTMKKGTSTSTSDPFYDQTSFTTLVNIRDGVY